MPAKSTPLRSAGKLSIDLGADAAGVSATVIDSLMVGDLCMWLYRATPATHDRCVGADHSLPATGRHARLGYGSILSSAVSWRSPALRL
jgi:hypothetical protein